MTCSLCNDTGQATCKDCAGTEVIACECECGNGHTTKCFSCTNGKVPCYECKPLNQEFLIEDDGFGTHPQPEKKSDQSEVVEKLKSVIYELRLALKSAQSALKHRKLKTWPNDCDPSCPACRVNIALSKETK